MRSKVLAVAAVLLIGWVARLAWDYFDEGSIAHQAMQVQLKLFGTTMHEYHSASLIVLTLVVWRIRGALSVTVDVRLCD